MESWIFPSLITLAIFLIVQLVAAVWWAATISSDVKYIRDSFTKSNKDQSDFEIGIKASLSAIHKRLDGMSFDLHDAIKDVEMVDGRITKIEKEVKAIRDSQPKQQ